jgi:aminoglycoside phosphotransferase (APT) family kinase protein
VTAAPGAYTRLDPAAIDLTLARRLGYGQLPHLRGRSIAGPPPPRRPSRRVDEEETLAALDDLDGEIARPAAERVWTDAMRSRWGHDPVWGHGDVAPGHLPIRHGRPAGVLDVGSRGVGDPACDTTIAWTLFRGPSRDRFRRAMGLDDAAWARGRGWALRKALITLRGHADRDSAADRRRLAEVLTP